MLNTDKQTWGSFLMVQSDIHEIMLTEAGIKKLEEERKKLITKDRPTVISAISAARDLGDLSENAEYHSAKEQQGFIEGRILQLDDILGRAIAFNPSNIKSDYITIGATVTALNTNNNKKLTFQIVSEYEADFDSGLISNTSPLGKALIKKTKSDLAEDNTIEVNNTLWEVLNFEYK